MVSSNRQKGNSGLTQRAPKRQKGDSGLAQRAPNNRRGSSSIRDETSDDDDSYGEDSGELDEEDDDEDSGELDEEDDDEEIIPSSSSKKVTFDTRKNATFKAPPRIMKRYKPNLGSLPNTGVWVSPSPGRHTEFKQVVVRTTKCDICNEKVGLEKEEKVMQRCCHCNKQFCKDCELRISDDNRHFPVLTELVWNALTKPNASSRPPGNFQENMYSRPKTVLRPVRPLTASERLAGMRSILPGSYNTVTVNNPTTSRPTRRSKATTSTKKKRKNNKRSLPSGYTSDEVDAHFELELEYIQKLPIAKQRKEMKAASMRALMRRRNLEVMEAPEPSELKAEPAMYTSRTPLPSNGISHSAMSRQSATPSSITARSSRGIAKSNPEPYIRLATADDSEINSDPLRNILDGLAQNRRAAEQADIEDPDLYDEVRASLIQDTYVYQEYPQVQNDQADEEEYQTIDN